MTSAPKRFMLQCYETAYCNVRLPRKKGADETSMKVERVNWHFLMIGVKNTLQETAENRTIRTRTANEIHPLLLRSVRSEERQVENFR